MLKFRSSFALLILLMLLASLAVPALAEQVKEVPDLNHPGSLKVRILDSSTKEPVPGGKVSIYLVASPVWKKDRWLMPLTADFTASGFDTSVIQEMTASQNAEQAQKLADFASQNQVKPTSSGVPDKDGAVKFEELPLGLYLVVQEEAASEYDSVSPFLISVPQVEKDAYIYDVDAAPKTGTVNHITEPTHPGHHDNQPNRPSHGLPQTGQLWWPVFLLAPAGVILFLLGWRRRKGALHE